MNWPALTAAIIAACVAVTLLAIIVCLTVGAWVISRAIHTWTVGQLEQRTWRASTRARARAPRVPTWVTVAWTAEPAVAPPLASTPTCASNQDDEPDLTDPHCGTDEQLLQAVWDIWRQPTREEDQK